MTKIPESGQQHLVHLDFLRGMAAFGVVAGHARSFVLVDYGSADNHSLLPAIFYSLTGLGHQCVIVFFALSGFLVGGQALRTIVKGRWSIASYLLRRLTRLWVVLLPALLLTFGVDAAGRLLVGQAGYDGTFYHLINAGPSPQSPADWEVTTLIGNVLFLQTVLVPVFGSNGPLWSLANEFWYYVTFPFIFAAILERRSFLSRVSLGAGGGIVLLLLPIDLVALGGIWVLGALAGWAGGSGYWPSRPWVLFFVTALNLALAGWAILLSKSWPSVSYDLLLGAAFACLLPTLAAVRDLGATYATVASSAANISYTLYATHFPILAFVWFVFFAPQKFQLGLDATCIMGGMVIAALSIASLMWWLFERNTDRIRNAAEAYLTFLHRTRLKNFD